MTDSSPVRSDDFSVELVKEVLGKRAECRFQVKGYSMSPFIKDGDFVTLSRFKGNSLSLGEVVAFIHPGNQRLVIHRVIKRRDKDYYVRGDNALEADGTISGEDILGIVRKVERGRKKVRMGLGPERLLIALLVRRNLLSHILFPVRKVLGPVARIVLW